MLGKDPKDWMRTDLVRAMDGKIANRKWGMYIDPEACSGCRSCMVACKAENNTPPAISYTMVLEEVHGTFPYTRRRYLPKPCYHCEQPSCVLACPVAATFRTADGTVVMDYMKCIGCRYCMTACPYASRSFDVGDWYSEGCGDKVGYEHRPSPDYSRTWTREHHTSPIGNVRKCHHCQHRLDKRLLPACVEACPSNAIVFGNLLDRNGLLAVKISTNATHRLKEDLGNEPTCYYKA